MLERQQPGLLNPVNFPGLLNPVGASVRGALQPARQFQPTIEWFFADKGSGQVDTANTFGATPTFTRATTATTIGPTGLVTSVGSGIPRSYYDPTTLAYLGYLAEGARTNLCLRSEEFDNASWVKTEATISANGATAPDGTTTADYFIPSVNAAAHFATQTITLGTSGATATVWAKVDSSVNKVTLFPGDSSTFAHFNLSNLTTSKEANVTENSIKAYPNGWYRLSATWPTVITLNLLRIYASSGALGASTTAGDGVSGIFLWGAQMENAVTFASTYIPTTTAAVVRNTDVLTYPTTGWIGSSHTLFSEFTPLQVSSGTGIVVGLHTDVNNRADIGRQVSAATGRVQCTDGGVTQSNTSTANSMTANVVSKIAGVIAENDFAVSLDGGAVATDSTGTIPSFSTIQIGILSSVGNNELNGPIRRVAYFARRLSNQHLQILTAG